MLGARRSTWYEWMTVCMSVWLVGWWSAGRRIVAFAAYFRGTAPCVFPEAVSGASFVFVLFRDACKRKRQSNTPVPVLSESYFRRTRPPLRTSFRYMTPQILFHSSIVGYYTACVFAVRCLGNHRRRQFPNSRNI